MSEEKKQYGMTLWDILYKLRYYLFVFLVIIGVVAFSIVHTFTEDEFVAIFTFILASAVSYSLSGLFGGLLLDASDLSSGFIPAQELDIWDTIEYSQREQIVVFGSNIGPILICSDKLYTKDKEHTAFEVAFNSKLAREIADFQKDWFMDYLRLDRVRDFEVTKELKREWIKLKETLGLEEATKNESE